MIAVIFEARAMPEQQDRYLALAAELKAELSHVAGFIEIERFQSLSSPGKVLSLSWWENEEAVRAWKCNIRHQAAQREGQSTIFAHYRIRVAQLLREYSLQTRACPHV
ncbi:antibiotic biosynthesis monooxygenase family protein [Kluyvera genomosp. 1]|uniref:antibiotic biosynthesis monooxygenase family protein n=1 Tax=Kluyvera genomosp. 1 TaxID=2774053 RepID=UPI00068DE356|nr:antibiotic biosynthesis monooxygenase [Kluyvera genomosp. 1]